MFNLLKKLFGQKEVQEEVLVSENRNFASVELVDVKPSLDSLISMRKIWVDFEEGVIKTSEGNALFSMENDKGFFLDIKYVQVTLKKFDTDFCLTNDQHRNIVEDKEKHLRVTNQYGKSFIDGLENHLTKITKEKAEFIQDMNETLIYRFWKQCEHHANCPKATIDYNKWSECQVS
ncbi:hypothetical protein ABEY63_25635 [Priestia aryabhattai]|uniref:hypothetical protein n=1 Tax=Priestia aryabhattai TaxID=412384 RepID=UPI003D291DEB